MRDYYIGIDPGQKGFVCVYDSAEKRYAYWPLSDEALIPFLRAFGGTDCMAVIEKVGAMPSQGRTSCFTFGENVGRVIGILECIGIPYVQVTPQKWQKEIWDSRDKVGIAGKNNKMVSYVAARRLHPDIDFRRTDKCKKFDDNKVDATLICDYAIRKNL